MAERRAFALDPYDLIRIMPAEATYTYNSLRSAEVF
jgi:hypothetical protein